MKQILTIDLNMFGIIRIFIVISSILIINNSNLTFCYYFRYGFGEYFFISYLI